MISGGKLIRDFENIKYYAEVSVTKTVRCKNEAHLEVVNCVQIKEK